MSRHPSALWSCNRLIDTVLAVNDDPFVAARVLRTHGNEYLQAAESDLAERCFMAALSLEAAHSSEEVRRRRPAND